MDVLITLGASSAYFYLLAGLIRFSGLAAARILSLKRCHHHHPDLSLATRSSTVRLW